MSGVAGSGRRLAYIANSAIPSRSANSVHVMKMCEALGESGFELTLIVPDVRDKAYSDRDPFGFYGVERNFRLRRIGLIRSTPKGWSHYLYAGLAVLAAGFRPGTTIFTRSLLTAYFAILCGRRVLLEMHDTPVAVSRRVTNSFIRRRLFVRPRFLGLIVISKPLKEHFVGLGWEGSKIHVIADAVNFRRFADIPRPVWDKPRYTVGYIGSLCEGRGVEVIHSLSELDQENDYRVIGGEEEEIRAWKRRTDGRSNITFEGHIENSEIVDRLGKMDILLMPYQRRISVSGNFGDTAKWASPMKMFEYMASGRPVISSEIPVLKEVLTHGETCLFVDPEKVDTWLGAIRSLKADPGLAARLGANARREVREKYTWEIRARRLKELLDGSHAG